MNNPIFETKRLHLEKLSSNHLDDLYALLSNANVHKYFPKTLNRQETEEFLETIQNKYKEDGTSFWAVIREEDGNFIGICGILKQLIDGIEEWEVAYRIMDSYWGNGYGTEAAAGCVRYAETILKKQSIVSMIRAINMQSVRVAEKNGMSLEKETIFYGLPHRMYRKRFAK